MTLKEILAKRKRKASVPQVAPSDTTNHAGESNNLPCISSTILPNPYAEFERDWVDF